MTQKLNYSPESGDLLLRGKEMDLESGWLGKFFGRSPGNIAGLLSVLLILSGIGVTVISLYRDASISTDYWAIISPLITLVLGYNFGKN